MDPRVCAAQTMANSIIHGDYTKRVENPAQMSCFCFELAIKYHGLTDFARVVTELQERAEMLKALRAAFEIAMA